MYFRGVNRGVTFTKPGFYLTGFVCLLGLFATSSGYNGFFLALGFGLSVLVISGLLSEKVMRAYECLGFSDAIVEPGSPFAVTFRMRNRSEDWVVLGADALVTRALPSFRLLPRETPSLLRSAPLSLAPGETALVAGSGGPLARGAYRDFFLVERTLYPFGLLYKFKVRSYVSRLLVLPGLDERFAEQLEGELRHRLQTKAMPEDFHSHRPLSTTDSHRRVDWRKSAGQPVEGWSVKVYESTAPDFGVLIAVGRGALGAAPDEASYERWLSRLRTACEVAGRGGKRIALDLGRDPIAGREAALEALAALPTFATRGTGPVPPAAPTADGWYLRLVVLPEAHRWGEEPERLGGGE